MICGGTGAQRCDWFPAAHRLIEPLRTRSTSKSLSVRWKEAVYGEETCAVFDAPTETTESVRRESKNRTLCYTNLLRGCRLWIDKGKVWICNSCKLTSMHLLLWMGPVIGIHVDSWSCDTSSVQLTCCLRKREYPGFSYSLSEHWESVGTTVRLTQWSPSYRHFVAKPPTIWTNFCWLFFFLDNSSQWAGPRHLRIGMRPLHDCSQNMVPWGWPIFPDLARKFSWQEQILLKPLQKQYCWGQSKAVLFERSPILFHNLRQLGQKKFSEWRESWFTVIGVALMQWGKLVQSFVGHQGTTTKLPSLTCWPDSLSCRSHSNVVRADKKSKENMIRNAGAARHLIRRSHPSFLEPK